MAPEPMRPEDVPAVLQQKIDIYPVGLLHDLAMFVHSPYRAKARRTLRLALRFPLSQARKGNWRAVKNYFNGYLAEAPDMTGIPRCGTGWTRGRAYRDLIRIARGEQP